MKRIISILFVLIMIFSTSVNAIVPHSTVEELGLNEGIFEYYFENSETFEILNKVLISYNKRFGYETDREIKIGEGENEITAAIFDEEKIIIYCKYIEESKVKDSVKSKNINYIFRLIFELTDDEYFNYIELFYIKLEDNNAQLSSLILPIIIDKTDKRVEGKSIPYRRTDTVLNIVNNSLGYLSLVYLIYVLIHTIYLKIKKKNIKHIKSKVVLFLLALFYLLMNGLNGIINCIFIIINSF